MKFTSEAVLGYKRKKFYLHDGNGNQWAREYFNTHGEVISFMIANKIKLKDVDAHRETVGFRDAYNQKVSTLPSDEAREFKGDVIVAYTVRNKVVGSDLKTKVIDTDHFKVFTDDNHPLGWSPLEQAKVLAGSFIYIEEVISWNICPIAITSEHYNTISLDNK